MGWRGTLEAAGLICLILVVLALAILLIRRRVIISHGGVFDCSLRRWHDGQPGGWAIGMARYSGDSFKWYRMFALIPRHSLQLDRDDMVLRRTRRVDALESLQLFEDQYVVELAPIGDELRLDLSMPQPSLVGLASWLEGAPAGRKYEAS